MRKIFIASDHAGFALKAHLIKKYPDVLWQDLGPQNEDRVDYPDFANLVAEALRKDPQAIGVLVCGSGQGMMMRANRFSHIRAALAWSEEVAQLAREHNDANVLCLGSRVTPEAKCEKIFETFISTPFAGGRHQDRVEKLGRSC